MDPDRLAELREKWTEAEEPLPLGSFRPELIPVLNFPSVDGPISIRAAVSPDCGFRLLREELRAGNDNMDIYIYNISASHIVREIESQVESGRAVRLMYDPNDDGVDENQRISDINGLDFQAAPSTGARSTFTVCHQKFVVSDKKSVFLGSANFANTSFPNVTEPGVFRKGNREWVVRIEHPDIAGCFSDLFQADWDIEAPAGLFELETPPQFLPHGVAPARLVNVPDVVFDIKQGTATRITPVVSPDNYLDRVLAAIAASTESIDIQQQDIKAAFDEEAAVDQLLQAVAARRAEAGVAVRILVSPKFSWNRSLDSVDAYDLGDTIQAIDLNRFTHLHNKGIIFDRQKVLVTSTNWSNNSITRAREAGVLIESTEIAEYFATTFDQDWEAGIPRDDVPSHLIDIRRQIDEHPESLIQLDSVPTP